MHIPKKYFHDRIILLLLTSLVFFTALTIIFISLNIGSDRSEGYIVQYRPILGLNAFEKGSSLEIVSFGIFAVMVLAYHTILSIKTYSIHKSVAMVVLALGILLNILALVISNALLLLR